MTPVRARRPLAPGEGRPRREERLGRALRARALTLAVAESCTGGLVGARVTGVAGSSGYFLGGVTAYHNRVKRGLLGVPDAMLRRHGAVSAPVAAAMARGARRALGSDLAVSVTGIAGPGGGSAAKPVGLVHAAATDGRRTLSRREVFSGDRDEVRRQAADMALDLLLALVGEGT